MPEVSLDIRQTVARIRALVDERQLDEHVSLVGELSADELGQRYDCTDVFVLATLGETYGMAVAEALAHGLPVVSTSTGAIPALVGTDAGLLVSPGDVQGLTHALARVIGDADLRARLTEGARRVRPTLPALGSGGRQNCGSAGVDESWMNLSPTGWQFASLRTLLPDRQLSSNASDTPSRLRIPCAASISARAPDRTCAT